MYLSPKLSLDVMNDIVSKSWINRSSIPFHIIRYDSNVFNILLNFATQYKLDAVLYQQIDDYKVIGNLVSNFNNYNTSTIIREFRKALKGYSLFI